MKTVQNPKKTEWAELTRRPTKDFDAIEKIVSPILDKVKRNGDRALKKFIWEYDNVQIDELLVSEEEIAAAEQELSKELKAAIHVAIDNIEKFHKAQKTRELEIETTSGVTCRRKSVPLNRIGLYIPGGTAPLFSTVLMLAAPARIAGVKEIVLCTPTNPEGKINPVVLYAAQQMDIKTIVKVGGAQAIAAMAYGTESIQPVDKIFGPGNQYVTAAKQLVSRDQVAIDMPAGPSEVLVIADDEANPAFVAADLLSQAEHGVDSQVVLVAFSQEFIDRVTKEVAVQLEQLPRKGMAEKSLENSMLILFEKKKQAIQFSNLYAPEHLIIATRKPNKMAKKITNAGSVFLGDYAPESAGDYASGTNHTLPTSGWARSMAGVSLDSFVKKITFQEITPEGLQELGPVVEVMAEAEQLIAHKNAVTIRLNYLSKNGKA